MKKIFILLALTFSFIVTVNSQNFFGGLIAGGITSQVEGDQRGGFNKLGFTAYQQKLFRAFGIEIHTKRLTFQ